MAEEIERKFLVISDQWRGQAEAVLYKQGYLVSNDETVVRVRIMGEVAMLTVKSKVSDLTRTEFEYEIPVDEADYMLENLCQKPLIDKTRTKIKIKNHVWEVDEFFGDNQGLLIAEVELGSEDEQVELPPWVGEDVSADSRYYNANLVINPYKNWKK